MILPPSVPVKRYRGNTWKDALWIRHNCPLWSLEMKWWHFVSYRLTVKSQRFAMILSRVITEQHNAETAEETGAKIYFTFVWMLPCCWRRNRRPPYGSAVVPLWQWLWRPRFKLQVIARRKPNVKVIFAASTPIMHFANELAGVVHYCPLSDICCRTLVVPANHSCVSRVGWDLGGSRLVVGVSTSHPSFLWMVACLSNLHAEAGLSTTVLLQ